MKLFTLEEANAMLPKLRRLLRVIQSSQALMKVRAKEAKQASKNSAYGGGIAQGSNYAEALISMINTLQTIAELGIEIKDLERGLCDFPSLRDGRIVYLCWLLGEERIEWWHDLEAGFAGRQPL